MSELLFFAVIAVATFVITVLILQRLIPYLKSKKLGQPILEIGPRWHKNKEGTPTMGGLSFIIASVLTGTVSCIAIGIKNGFRSVVPFILTLSFAVLCGLIGCIDDAAKLRKKQNEGLSAKQKFALQTIAAALYIVGLHFCCDVTTSVFIPYFGVTVDFGIAYYILALLLIVGIDNSVNLTDGVDGLSGSVTFTVSLFFGAASLFSGDGANISLALLSAVTAGSTGGFLVYNFYPARVFMGDTGSLFLGALVVGSSFVLGNPLIVVVAGLIYIVETASVMLQVGYFKLTGGKRLFKMAPIHHHFEKSGFGEVQIVGLFTALTVLFCVAAWFGL